MTRRMVLLSLEREKFVNRPDRGRVARSHAHFPTPRPVDRLILDRAATFCHDPCSRHGLVVDLERFGEIARAERALDVAHVRANRRDGGAICGVVALQDDPAAVGEILENVRGGVLVDAHDMSAAGLHRGEVVVRPLAGRD
jgi:hypothetical protein